MCSANTRIILPEPPEELKRLSEQLADMIGKKIRLEGPISFADYMEIALYEPGRGYYSAGLQKFGEGGDFITAPQLGNVFASCLAKQVDQVAAELGSYEILEAGAGTGALAADLLAALQDNRPPSCYNILERSAHLRQVQKESLQRKVPQWMDRVNWLNEPPHKDWQGVFVANEVLDALTVERFCIADDDIRQLKVIASPGGFSWYTDECPQDLRIRIQHALASFETLPAEGFCSEINTDLPAWLQAVTGSLRKGAALFIDYGYARCDYYQPQRSNGTLICHYRHRAHDDPFKWPGLTDISASVEFTALAEAADFCGLDVSGYTSQAMFLLGCGLQDVINDFQSLSDKQRVLKNIEVRKLTLPGEMGERFQVMALGRGLSEDLNDNLLGFSLSDLRYRL